MYYECYDNPNAAKKQATRFVFLLWRRRIPWRTPSHFLSFSFDCRSLKKAMPYGGRRNFSAYQRSISSGGSAALPTNNNTTQSSLTSYRNKISLILILTSVYTAFLYHRGWYFLLFLFLLLFSFCSLCLVSRLSRWLHRAFLVQCYIIIVFTRLTVGSFRSVSFFVLLFYCSRRSQYLFGKFRIQSHD